MRAFSCLLSFSSVASAVLITVSEYPQYCRMPSSSVDVFATSRSTPSVAISGSINSSEAPGSSTSTLSEAISSSTISSKASGSSSSSAAVSHGSATPTGSVPFLGAVVHGTPVDTVSQLFWVNYAEAIREAAGIEITDNNAFYLGTQAQKGPLAGSYIPDEYTNEGLYQIANNLLNTSTMFYTPDDSHGYVQALSNYMDNVDLDGHPSSSQEVALLNALKAQASAQDAELYQLGLANKKYTLETGYGLYPTQDFGDWLLVAGNAPGYATAVRATQQAANQVDAIQANIYGTKSNAWSTDRALIAKAFDQTANQTGYNMRAAFGNTLSVADLIAFEKRGEDAPVPRSQFVPLYNAPRYKDFVDESQVKAGAGPDNYEPAQSRSFTVDASKSASDFNFGQTDVAAKYGGGWFYSFGASGAASTTTSSLQTSSAYSSVSINITYDAIEVIDITPGLWNIDVSQYKLRKDAPLALQQLVKPTQLVVANRLGYEITISDSQASSFDTYYKQVVAAKGGFRVFGITIWGGSAGHTDTRNTHDATYDSATSTFKVVPRDDVGVANLVGLVGSKFNILTV